MSFQLSSLPKKLPEYVYLIENELGLVKIGISTNPAKRFKSISLNSGLMIVKQHLSPLCFNARAIEQQMHAQFVAYRVKGEWFKGIDFDTLKSALDGYFNNFVATVESQRDNSPFEFNFNGHLLRTFKDETGEIWFCLKDACNVLDINNPSDVVKRLDPPGVDSIDLGVKTGIKQNGSNATQQVKVTFVNEPNLYRVIFRSDKPQAKAFQDWVFEEVLPAIRKTGGYGVNGELATQVYELQRQVTALQNEVGFISNVNVVKQARNKAYQLATLSQSDAEGVKAFLNSLDESDDFSLDDFVSEYVEAHSSQRFFTITEILDALEIPPTSRKQLHLNQVAYVLKSLGYEKERPRISGKRVCVYSKTRRRAFMKSLNSLKPSKGV